MRIIELIDPYILRRFHELGGNTPSGDASLKEFLLGTTFPHYLYPKDWDPYGLEELLEKNRSVRDHSLDAFLDLMVKHYFAQHDFACGQDFWQPKLFTPLTPGTTDFKEWESWFGEYVDLSPVRALCGEGRLEFVQIIHSYGYPDHYYVCLDDPTPENPTVFGTDHEMFFQEISSDQSLLELLESYCTEQEFRTMMRRFLVDHGI